MQTIVAAMTDLFFTVKVMDGAKLAGRQAKFASSLAGVLELARNSSPAMIVADLNCREIDCLELARQMKADPTLKAIPLLGFVSHVQEAQKKAAQEAGFDRVVARSLFSDQARQLMAG
jgi:CheY-like chemotaxis protein